MCNVTIKNESFYGPLAYIHFMLRTAIWTLLAYIYWSKQLCTCKDHIIHSFDLLVKSHHTLMLKRALTSGSLERQRKHRSFVKMKILQRLFCFCWLPPYSTIATQWSIVKNFVPWHFLEKCIWRKICYWVAITEKSRALYTQVSGKC